MIIHGHVRTPADVGSFYMTICLERLPMNRITYIIMAIEFREELDSQTCSASDQVINFDLSISIKIKALGMLDLWYTKSSVLPVETKL